MSAADWRDRAACLDEHPDTFFPPNGGDGRTKYLRALAVCDACPVTSECLGIAFAAERGLSRRHRFGVFGGLTPGERSALDGHPRPKVLAGLAARDRLEWARGVLDNVPVEVDA